MKQSLIYHGGGPGKGGFSGKGEVDSGKYFTLCYATGEDMAVNDLINPPTEISFSIPSAGYHLGKSAKLQQWHCLAVSYSESGSSGELGLSLRYSPADGSRTSPLISITGTLYHGIVMVFPGTGGATRYYYGKYQDNLNAAVPANSIIHCAVNAITLSDLDGIVLWLQFKED